MAANLDDLAYLLAGLRSDTRAGFEGLGDAVGGRGGSVGGPPAPAGGGGFLAGLSGGLQAVARFAGTAQSAVFGLAGTLSRFVGQANPAAVVRLNMAMADLQAVVGRALQPVLERVTGVVRTLADAFVSLSPAAQKLVTGIAAGAGLAAVLVGVVRGAKLLTAVLGGWPAVLGAVAAAFVGVAASMDSGRELGRAFSQVLRVVGTAVEVIARAVVPVVSAVLVPALGVLARVLAAVGSVVGSVVRGLGPALSAVGTVAGVLARVLGGVLSALSPVLATVGRLAGSLAAALGGVAGVLGAVVSAVAGVLGSALTTLVHVLGHALAPALEVVASLVEGVGLLFTWLAERLQDVTEALGFGRSDYRPDARSSVGAAARQAQFSGLQEFANRAYASAFGAGSPSDVPKAQLGELRGIRGGIDRLPDRLADAIGRRGDGTPGGGTAAGRVGRSAAVGAGFGFAIAGPAGAIPGAGVGFAVQTLREIFR